MNVQPSHYAGDLSLYIHVFTYVGVVLSKESVGIESVAVNDPNFWHVNISR